VARSGGPARWQEVRPRVRPAQGLRLGRTLADTFAAGALTSTPLATPPTSPTPPLKERLQKHLAEYGSVAIWVYFGIFAIVLVGFATAIKMGVEVESAAGTAGTWGAAWLATKLTQPLRILATFVVTPFVVRVLRRGKRPPSQAPSGSP
jgi:hypothetical protein